MKWQVFVIAISLLTVSCKSLSPVDGRVERLVVAPLPEAVTAQWRPFAADGEHPDSGGSSSGLAYYAGKISRPRLEFNALRVDLSNPALRIYTAGGGGGSVDGSDHLDVQFPSVKVSSFVRDNNLTAGINALPFDPVSGAEGEPRTNIGIVVSDGEMISPPYPQFDALVFYADGSAAIAAQSAIHSSALINNAVGGFHRILEKGELVPRVLDVTARHPRSAAGISSDGRYLYLLVIDGRRPGSIGSTEAETALLLRALGATDGINFDGGGSSALALRYPDGKVRVANTPIHAQIPGLERAVAGCLGIGSVIEHESAFSLQYPVVLVHGIIAHDRGEGQNIFWGRIPEVLRKNGVPVFFGNTDAWGHYESNAEILKNTIEKVLQETNSEKVNIIAHSKGGIDSRYLIWKYDFGDKVASLTTISTPHHGAEVADAIFNRKLIHSEITKKNLEIFGELYGDTNPDMYNVNYILTTEKMKEFNEKVIRDNRVLYHSMYTVMDSAYDDIRFTSTYRYIKKTSGPNDGLVSERSAIWGDNVTKINGNISHAEILDIRRRKVSGIDIPDIYLDIVRGLAERGF